MEDICDADYSEKHANCEIRKKDGRKEAILCCSGNIILAMQAAWVCRDGNVGLLIHHFDPDRNLPQQLLDGLP